MHICLGLLSMPGSPYEHEGFAYCLSAMLASLGRHSKKPPMSAIRPVHAHRDESAYPLYHQTLLVEGNTTSRKGSVTRLMSATCTRQQTPSFQKVLSTEHEYDESHRTSNLVVEASILTSMEHRPPLTRSLGNGRAGTLRGYTTRRWDMGIMLCVSGRHWGFVDRRKRRPGRLGDGQ